MKDWKSIDLCGAESIARVSGIYDITELKKVPGIIFRVKVLERVDGSYIASTNLRLKATNGTSDWPSGAGKTEVEALQNAVRCFMAELDKREDPTDDDFEWATPIQFL